ncbi:amidohydrolase, partial [Allofrancisella guangzhouensis]|uniref:amidohydrolase family protein n=1 Tax=Allofrancisella guangzhouensis TaxID=594679 RepID=UPI00190361BC
MKIIDSHIHFWDTSNGFNNWVNKTELPKLVIPNDFNVDSFVHIEAHNSNQDILCEYKWIKSKFLNKNIKVIAFVDFTQDIKGFKKDIAVISKYDDIVGVRHIMAKTYRSKYSPFNNTIPKDLLEKLRILKENDLIFEAQMYPEQFLPLLTLIDKSEVKMAIEHFGLPIFGENNNLTEWYSLIREMNNHSKWYLKLSGFDLNNDNKYTYEAMALFLNPYFNKLSSNN